MAIFGLTESEWLQLDKDGSDAVVFGAEHGLSETDIEAAVSNSIETARQRFPELPPERVVVLRFGEQHAATILWLTGPVNRFLAAPCDRYVGSLRDRNNGPSLDVWACIRNRDVRFIDSDGDDAFKPVGIEHGLRVLEELRGSAEFPADTAVVVLSGVVLAARAIFD